MGLGNKIRQYKEYKRGINHCTLDPNGPGVVRIHLVPPKFSLLRNDSYVVILNGYYILPIGYSYAVILSNFIDNVNMYDGKEMGEDCEKEIVRKTVNETHRTYPMIRRTDIEEDLNEILDVIFAVARNEIPNTEIEKLSIRNYSKCMTAPHRMDLMVSAMTDENGNWKCNQRCRFCYAAGQSRASSKELDTSEWKKIIDKLYDAGVPMVTFTGGEPTLRADICELVGHAKCFVTRLNTNGVALTKELVDELKKASLDSLQATLYSHDERVHNELVGAERFRDTVNGIRRAVSAGLDVSINTPLCKKNSDYVKTLEFIKSLGVKFVTSSGLICTGMAEDSHSEYDLDSEELYGVISKAKAFCDQNNMEIDFTSPGLISKERLESLKMKVPACGAALSNMAIAPDGTVVPCQSWLTVDSSLGNILNGKWKKIWNSKLAKSLRVMTEDEALACPFRNNLFKGGKLK